MNIVTNLIQRKVVRKDVFKNRFPLEVNID